LFTNALLSAALEGPSSGFSVGFYDLLRRPRSEIPGYTEEESVQPRAALWESWGLQLPLFTGLPRRSVLGNWASGIIKFGKPRAYVGIYFL
jgi:hypothetical protein